MKKGLKCWILLFMLALVTVGCATSQPARFYTLNAISKPEPDNASSVVTGKTEIIGVGPVSIPDSLDRPQIVTLSGENEVRIAEFDRWSGGSYRDEIARVMTENLAVLLPSQRVVSYAWGRRVSLNRQITVDILRLDGVLGKTVILKANWAILEESGTKTILVRRSDISEPVNGGDYASLAAALSRALGTLSREIAAAAQSPK
ncbi:MAG: PqiC family protein [Syntrophus sp. (in: bacteria)]